MLKLTGFSALAEVLGEVRGVVFTAAGELTIRDLTMATAQDVLTALATGKVRAADDTVVSIEGTVAPNVAEVPPVAAHQESALEKHHREQREQDEEDERAAAQGAEDERAPDDRAAKATDAGTPKPERTRRSRSRAKSKPVPPPEDLEAELSDPNKAAAAAQEPPWEEPAGAPAPADSAAKGGNGNGKRPDPFNLYNPSGDLPDELRTAHKIRDVLSFLMTKGVSSPDDFVAECERVKHGVPVLARIANLEERVIRTLSVMDRG